LGVATSLLEVGVIPQRPARNASARWKIRGISLDGLTAQQVSGDFMDISWIFHGYLMDI